jgi:hypothetical protein
MRAPQVRQDAAELHAGVEAADRWQGAPRGAGGDSAAWKVPHLGTLQTAARLKEPTRRVLLGSWSFCRCCPLFTPHPHPRFCVRCYPRLTLPPPHPHPRQCCADRTSSFCYPTLEAACPGDADAAGAICTGTQQYLDVFSQVTVDAISRLTSKESASGRAFFSIKLPRFDLGTNELLAGATVESKMVAVTKPLFGKMSLDKSSIVPKCFTKCCSRWAGALPGSRGEPTP